MRTIPIPVAYSELRKDSPLMYGAVGDTLSTLVLALLAQRCDLHLGPGGSTTKVGASVSYDATAETTTFDPSKSLQRGSPTRRSLPPRPRTWLATASTRTLRSQGCSSRCGPSKCETSPKRKRAIGHHLKGGRGTMVRPLS